MSVLRRSVRDAGAPLALLAVLCIGVSLAVIDRQDALRQGAQISEARAAAAAYAGAIASGTDRVTALQAAFRDGFDVAAVLDARGQVFVSVPAGALTEAQARSLPAAPGLATLAQGGARHVFASASVSGGRLVLLRELRSGGFNWGVMGLAVPAWLLAGGLLVAAAARGKRLDPDAARLADQLATGAHVAIDRERAVKTYGPSAHLLFDMAAHLESTRAERDEARELGRNLLQMGAHYTLLCDLEGRVIDANPSFLARAGLTPDEMRQRGREVLRDLLPMHEVAALAERSLMEGATLSGIPCMLAFPSGSRQVEVALRAFRMREAPAVLLVMTDRKREDELERQIDQFTDSIELMVDQRVARITAGSATVEAALADAGLALFDFDPAGALLRMNAGAERLTGRTQFTLRTLADVSALFFRGEASHRAFHAWFASDWTVPFQASIPTPAGPTRAVMLRTEAHQSTNGPRRILACLAVPADAAAGPQDLDEPVRRIDALAASLDPAAFPAGVRPYVDVIREAVRRLDSVQHASGDGSVARAVPHE